MVRKVIWTEKALADLEGICQFIARDSEAYARIFAKQVFEAVDNIGRFPLVGRMAPKQSRKTIREIFLGEYRIVYHIKSGAIELLSIIHGARNR
jgi:plasmid stabilization system protein ParE